MMEFKIRRIKNHIFFDRHNLMAGMIGKTDPSASIVETWERLREGNFVQNDLYFLDHVYFEARFKSLYKTNLRVAHGADFEMYQRQKCNSLKNKKGSLLCSFLSLSKKMIFNLFGMK